MTSFRYINFWDFFLILILNILRIQNIRETCHVCELGNFNIAVSVDFTNLTELKLPHPPLFCHPRGVPSGSRGDPEIKRKREI
jgi:hypothetical protein